MKSGLDIYRFWLSTALTAIAMTGQVVHAQAPVCPAIGHDKTCGTLITVTDSGSVPTFTGEGPYDGEDDTLVGVINNSSQPVRTLRLKSANNIFGFDSDGIVGFGATGNSTDPTGYGGPNAYFSDINATATEGTVHFIVPIPAHGGTGYFSLENALSQAVSCADVINKAVKVTASGANIDATFAPNGGVSLQQAAQDCGFVNFNWTQQITKQDDPSAFSARNIGGAFDATVSGPVRLTSKRAPWADPPQGGGYTTDAIDNGYPYYYDIRSELAMQEAGGLVLAFHDAPSDPCLRGGAKVSTSVCDNSSEPRGSFGAYETHLVGVNADATPTDLGISFAWTSDYNGTTGGISIKKTHATADGNGTGGVKITRIVDVTNYQYNGLTVTAVNDGAIVQIDIRPATQTNRINLRRNKINVAVLSSATLDAPSAVKQSTLGFGETGAEKSFMSCKKHGKDVNRDGRSDLICQFNIRKTALRVGDTAAILTFTDASGKRFTGQDSVVIISNNGNDCDDGDNDDL